jgi:outer membrane protein OmpA-like peptidoglycan-associated protein
MTTPRRHLPLAAVALALVTVTVLPASALASPSPEASATARADTSVDVAVHGTPVPIRQGREADKPVGYAAVHGVQRIDGATVLYYSLGWPEDADDTNNVALGRRAIGSERYNGNGIGITQGRVIDPIGLKAYTTLPRPEGTGSISSRFGALGDDPGTMYVIYQVLPPLPPEVQTVDVWLGFGSIVPGVPVEDGLLEPTVAGDDPIPLGTGWPEVDLDLVAQSPQPELSIYDLQQRNTTLDQTQTTTETSEAVTIDVATDVLFALDSADLSGDASHRIAEVVQQVNARAAAGEIAIVGHTDSQGTDAYNDDLSRRRAQAVADVVRPAVTVPGATFRVEGRGEAEPIADNSTPEGQQANRRVTVTFTTKD